ncbi:hypothetical protein [Sinanaerobacter chloroacetimidivorans]|uniref:Uncharacterized protein n=1 Tax=Sinanaerobacter chloroacetimidivorans TaxID=2818044 RepID=A0A8J8B2R7_9FIRM|nr:hypothetical protein [Sinanaerobacter chloroacetimidivorans]MBR0597520.1 hypothetical protein [Sinanaerobacter chloroacetimidivorans]
MQPLITIETVPIKIEYVEKEPYRSSSVQTASLKISQQEDQMTIQSNPISIPLQDSFEPSSSIDWNHLYYTATAQYSNDGNLQMNVRIENSTDNDYQFQQFQRGIDHIIDSLPKTTDSNYQFQSMQISFDISQLPSGMPSVSNLDTSFLPPDLELKVVERPKVIIKYVGGPLYIPKSADPNYVPPEYHDQICDGKTAFDVKA